MEYLIEIRINNEVTHVVNVEKDKRINKMVASATNYMYCSKFRVKERALKVAKNIPNAVVVPSFGGFVTSTKTSVAPIASKVNKPTPYRSI